MGKTILFSPVGGTDPISKNNFYDGALIHSCRVYKPDMIYMYMSKEILDNEAKDSRYTFCLKRLYEQLGKELSYSIIERPELVEVHDFNLFYDDFRSEIKKISSEMDVDDDLFLNTSSGTPAMKSALVVLVTLGDIKGRLIQVPTPENRMNSYDPAPYDAKTYWDMYVENTTNFVDRSAEIVCHSLAQIKNEEMIKSLIRSYDYSAALEMAKMMNPQYTARYIHLLEYACFRMKMDYKHMSKLESEFGVESVLPVQNSKYRNAVEYTLSLFLKEKREEYGDFVRGLTPLILELFILILEKKTKINARDYCFKDNKTTGYKWDMNKIINNSSLKDWLDIWNSKFDGGFKSGYLKAVDLLYVIQEKCDPQTVDKAKLLRIVETNVRNNAAHEIKMVSAETVNELAGYSFKQIKETIISLFRYVGIDSSDSVWESYDNMNGIIIDHIGPY